MRFKFFFFSLFFYQGIIANYFSKSSLNYLDKNKKNIIIQSSLIFLYDIIYIRKILKKDLEKKPFFNRSFFSILAITAPYSFLKIIDLLKTKKNIRKKNIKNSLISLFPYLLFINLLKLKN